MYTTYYIESLVDGNIYAYYTRLYQAKYDLVKMFKPNKARIVCLKGYYKFEGGYWYKLTYDGNKFIKEKVR